LDANFGGGGLTFMEKVKNILLIIGIIVVIFIFTSIGFYNGFAHYYKKIEASVSEIDSQQQKRNNLIPDLINTVRWYASDEKEIFESIAEARNMYSCASSITEKIKADQEISFSLSRLKSVAENYPKLKSDKHFTDLIMQLGDIENNLSVARGNYNDLAKEYNSKISKFPCNIFAKMYNINKQPYYNVDKTDK
jgi:LemA protein